MSKGSPQNGPESSRSAKTAPSRSSRRPRGSFKRNRSSQMNTFMKVLVSVNKLGAGGKEFGTAALRDEAGVSMSQAYTWLQVLRTHKFITGRIVKSRRPSGDWRWKRQFKIVKV